MIYPYEVAKCDATGELLVYGDFYYEDDETHKIISKKFYDTQKDQQKRDNFAGTKRLEGYTTQKERMEASKEAEREALQNSLLNNTVFGKTSDNYAKGWELK